MYVFISFHYYSLVSFKVNRVNRQHDMSRHNQRHSKRYPLALLNFNFACDIVDYNYVNYAFEEECTQFLAYAVAGL